MGRSPGLAGTAKTDKDDVMNNEAAKAFFIVDTMSEFVICGMMMQIYIFKHSYATKTARNFDIFPNLTKYWSIFVIFCNIFVILCQQKAAHAP